MQNINVAELMISESFWEILEYLFAFVVTIACAGEYIHEFKSWFKRNAWWREQGGRASARLLVAALALEIPTQFKVNAVSGMMVNALGVQEAQTRIRAAEIERKYAWRTITPEESAALLKALGPRRFPLVLQYFVSDPEAFEFAGEFENLLSKSRLVVIPHNIIPLTPPLGIMLLGPDSPEKTALGDALRAAGFEFRSANVQLTAVDDLNALRLSIGGRFPPK